MQINRDSALKFGIILGLLSLIGCRLGNRVEYPPNPDQISGYYSTAAQFMKLCINAEETRCTEVSAHQAPPEIAAVMTDPVALILKDPSTGRASWVGTDGQNYSLPVTVGSDQSLSFLGSSAPQVLWADEKCTSQLWLEEKGGLNSADKGKAWGKSTLSGRAELDVQVIRIFDGDCKASLKEMQICYQDSTQCGGSSDEENTAYQEYIKSIFDRHIEEGLLTAEEIPSITQIGYQVFYQ